MFSETWFNPCVLFLCCIECYNINLFVINVKFVSSIVSNTLSCQVTISHYCFHIPKLLLIITTKFCVVIVFCYIASRKLTYYLYVRKNILTENMKDSQSQDKTCWTREVLNIFYAFIPKQLRKVCDWTHISTKLDENMLWMALRSRPVMH